MQSRTGNYRQRALGGALMGGLLLAVSVVLSACGFAPRGSVQWPFQTVHLSGVQIPAQIGVAVQGDTVAAELQRQLQGQGLNVSRNAASRAGSDVTIHFFVDEQTRTPIGSNIDGLVREVRLTRRVEFAALLPTGEALIPRSSLEISREISYTEAVAVSKAAEERALFDAMQTDLAEQMVRRVRLRAAAAR